MKAVAQLLGKDFRRGLKPNGNVARKNAVMGFGQNELVWHQGGLNAFDLAVERHVLHPCSRWIGTSPIDHCPFHVRPEPAVDTGKGGALAEEVQVKRFAVPPTSLKHRATAHGDVGQIKEFSQGARR